MLPSPSPPITGGEGGTKRGSHEPITLGREFADCRDYVIRCFGQSTKRRDAQVIFKDGFSIIGKVNESVREIIYDSKSGRSFPIFSGQFFLDDNVRFIRFSPGSVQKVVELKPGEVKDPEKIVRVPVFSEPYEINSNWLFTNFGKWAENGERSVTVRIKTPKGEGNKVLTQKIGLLTPQYLHAYTIEHRWQLLYKTNEFTPEYVRALLLQVYSERKALKELKPAAKFLKIAAFCRRPAGSTKRRRNSTTSPRTFRTRRRKLRRC